MNRNYCIVCPGELTEETEAGEWTSIWTGEYYCSECGIKYEFIPPLHLQKRPSQPVQTDIVWKDDNI